MSMRHVQRIRMLYKTILRLHKGLPGSIQSFGSQYVRDEFRRHKMCTHHEAVLFEKAWTNYAIQMANQLGVKGKPHPDGYLGEDLDVHQLEHFRDEQIAQLYELLLAAKGFTNDHKKNS